MVPELHGDADDFIALFQQQRRGHTRINPAGHGSDYAFPRHPKVPNLFKNIAAIRAAHSTYFIKEQQCFNKSLKGGQPPSCNKLFLQKFSKNEEKRWVAEGGLTPLANRLILGGFVFAVQQ
jgi:hypothetical protein